MTNVAASQTSGPWEAGLTACSWEGLLHVCQGGAPVGTGFCCRHLAVQPQQQPDSQCLRLTLGGWADSRTQANQQLNNGLERREMHA